jgi:hypothetical protein
MIIFAFHAEKRAFSKCFPKKMKEKNHSSASPTFPRFWKWSICAFTPSPYAMEKMFNLIDINSI